MGIVEQTIDIVRAIKARSRKLHKGMPKGGFHSAPKGKKGYTRKLKHKGDAE
jgi:hypothetical protein